MQCRQKKMTSENLSDNCTISAAFFTIDFFNISIHSMSLINQCMMVTPSMMETEEGGAMRESERPFHVMDCKTIAMMILISEARSPVCTHCITFHFMNDVKQ